MKLIKSLVITFAVLLPVAAVAAPTLHALQDSSCCPGCPLCDHGDH